MKNMTSLNNIQFDDFAKVDIRTGTIKEVLDFPEARKPAWKLVIDFGNGLGIKKSSAQITELYHRDELVGKQIMAVVNFPPKQIGPFLSEVLVLGFVNGKGEIVLACPEMIVPDGARLC